MNYRETEEQKEARYNKTVRYLRTSKWSEDDGTVAIHTGPEFNYDELSEERAVVITLKLPSEVADCIDEEREQHYFSGIIEDMRQAAIQYVYQKRSTYY